MQYHNTNNTDNPNGYSVSTVNKHNHQGINPSSDEHSGIGLDITDVAFNEENIISSYMNDRKVTAYFPTSANDQNDEKNEVDQHKNLNVSSQSAHNLLMSSTNQMTATKTENSKKTNKPSRYISNLHKSFTINLKPPNDINCIIFNLDPKTYTYSLNDFTLEKIQNKCSINDIQVFFNEIYKATSNFSHVKCTKSFKLVIIIISILSLLAGIGCIVANTIINTNDFISQTLFYISIGLFGGFLITLSIALIIIPTILIKPAMIIKPKIDEVIYRIGKAFENLGLKWKCTSVNGDWVELWLEYNMNKPPNEYFSIGEEEMDKSKIEKMHSMEDITHVAKAQSEFNSSLKSSSHSGVNRDRERDVNKMNTSSNLLPTQYNDDNNYHNLYFKNIETSIQNHRIIDTINNNSIHSRALDANEANIGDDDDDDNNNNNNNDQDSLPRDDNITNNGFIIDVKMVSIEESPTKNSMYISASKMKRNVHFFSPDKH